MKSAFKITTILFFITLSFSSFGQTFKIQSVTKGVDFNEYSSRSRDYFEELIDVMSKFTITIKEGNLAIISMDKSDWKLLFRFYRNANILKMSQEDYLKVNEFHCNSDIINGINYQEMSVERVSGEISLGEIRFYPEEGLHKPIFTIVFSSMNKTNSSDKKSSNNAFSTKEDNSKQRLVFVNIDHVPNFDYESLNKLKNNFSDSEISVYETENNAYIEISMNDGSSEKWEFYKIFGGEEETDEFITLPNDSTIPKKMSIKRHLGKISNIQIGYYDKEKQMNGGAFLIVYLRAPKDQAENDKIIESNKKVAIKKHEEEQKSIEKERQKIIEITSKIYDLQEYNILAYTNTVDNIKEQIKNYLFTDNYKNELIIPSFTYMLDSEKNIKRCRFQNTYNVNFKFEEPDKAQKVTYDEQYDFGYRSFQQIKEIELVSGTDKDCLLFKYINLILPVVENEGYAVRTQAHIDGINVDYVKGITIVKVKNGIAEFKKYLPYEDIEKKIGEKLRSTPNGKYTVKYEYCEIMGEEELRYSLL